MVDYSSDLRETKQTYLVDNVLNPGYDQQAFAEFMNSKKGKQCSLLTEIGRGRDQRGQLGDLRAAGGSWRVYPAPERRLYRM